MTSSSDITRVLAELTGGCADAADRLMPLVYDELRTMADRCLRDESGQRTLQPTALVHEVYIRLAGHNGASWESRAQFFAVAARAMRHLLIDHARRRRAAKRGGARERLSLEEVGEPAGDRDDFVVALDDALHDLAELDPQLARVVELRFFGGLSVPETARVLGVSPVTVKRRWKLARGWLHREMSGGEWHEP